MRSGRATPGTERQSFRWERQSEKEVGNQQFLLSMFAVEKREFVTGGEIGLKETF